MTDPSQEYPDIVWWTFIYFVAIETAIEAATIVLLVGLFLLSSAVLATSIIALVFLRGIPSPRVIASSDRITSPRNTYANATEFDRYINNGDTTSGTPSH